MFVKSSDLRTDEIFLHLERTEEGDKARGWLPGYRFTIRRTPDACEVGQLNFRIGSEEAVRYIGHIGYRVYEAYRGHHYAAKACELAFELARRHGMDALIITCNPRNLASARTCELCGGVLEGTFEIPHDHEMYLRGERQVNIYRVTL